MIAATVGDVVAVCLLGTASIVCLLAALWLYQSDEGGDE